MNKGPHNTSATPLFYLHLRAERKDFLAQQRLTVVSRPTAARGLDTRHSQPADWRPSSRPCRAAHGGGPGCVGLPRPPVRPGPACPPGGEIGRIRTGSRPPPRSEGMEPLANRPCRGPGIGQKTRPARPRTGASTPPDCGALLGSARDGPRRRGVLGPQTAFHVQNMSLRSRHKTAHPVDTKSSRLQRPLVIDLRLLGTVVLKSSTCNFRGDVLDRH